MAIIKRLDGFGVQVYIPARLRKPGDKPRKWVGTFPTYEAAQDAEKIAEGKIRTRVDRVTGSETIREFCKRWPEEYNRVLSDGSMRWSEDYVRTFPSALAPFVQRFGDELIGDFPVSEAFPWASTQKTFNLKIARSMFNDARKSGLIHVNPLAELGLEQSRGRKDLVVITTDELDLLCTCAREVIEDEEHALVMEALLMWQGTVGTRMIGASNLRPDDVNLKDRTVYVRKPGKKVPPRTIFIPDKAAVLVGRMPQRPGAAWLFTSRNGGKFNKSNLHYSFDPIRREFDSRLDPRRAAELRDGRPKANNKNGFLQMHELRHKAATDCARAGLDKQTAAFQLCQTDEGDLVARVYTHLTDQERIGFMRKAFQEQEDRQAQDFREVADG